MLLAGLVAACQPEPRSATYFEAHPEETARVLAACKAGSQRGPECEAARAGEAAIKANARQELFRKGFE